ncbi:hypothetical protein V9T40_009968 [Parthenolecanium corni]|uniref:Uncharacterized protein n=1 Tax=Parthenolecanium corni TaxID=536013 RepID=A0AAN9TK08_9HEMI
MLKKRFYSRDLNKPACSMVGQRNFTSSTIVLTGVSRNPQSCLTPPAPITITINRVASVPPSLASTDKSNDQTKKCIHGQSAPMHLMPQTKC